MQTDPNLSLTIMNTPETDKAERMAYSGEYMVPTEFARQLERERDEALRHLEEIKEYGTEEINAAVELRQKLAAALIERDEARKEAEDWKKAYETVSIY